MQKETRKPLWQVLTVFAALFFILSVFLGLVFQLYVKPAALGKDVTYYSVASKNRSAEVIVPDGSFSFTQSFTAKDSISAYQFFIGFTDEKKAERELLTEKNNGNWVRVHGEITITLRDGNGNAVDVYELDEDLLNEALWFGWLWHSLDNIVIGGVRGQTYTLEFTGNLPENSGICFRASDRDYYRDGALLQAGEALSQDLAFYIVSPAYTMICLLFIAFSAGLLAAFTVIYFCAYIFHIKKHILFLITVLLMGMGYSALITPYHVPDETAHYYTAYRVSNALTWTKEKAEDADADLYVRACDTDYQGIISTFNGKNYKPSVSTYAAVVNNVLGAEESEEMLLLHSEQISGNYVCYIPAGIGIAIGRALHLNSVPTFYLGRMMNLLLFAILGMLAVRKMPFGKNILFAAALLPLTLQQVASYSYDSVIIAFAFYYIATCLHLAYRAKQIRVTDIAALLVCLMVFCAPKAGVYVLMAGFLPIIFWNKQLPKKNKLLVMGIAAVSAFAFMLIFNLSRLGGSASAADAPLYFTLSDILKAPKAFAALWVNAYFESKEIWFYALFGSDMGLLNVQVEKTFALLFGSLLMISSIREGERAKFQMRNTDKWFMIPVVLLTIAGFCAASYLWTPIGSTAIQGLQTRYIIPVLPLILLSLQTSALTCRKSITNFLTVSLVVTNAFYIVDALNAILLT